MSNHTPYSFLQDLTRVSLRHTLGSHRFKHSEGWTSGVLWHPSSESFFTIHDRTRILQTSVTTGEPLGEVVEIGWWVNHMAVSPDGERWLLTGMMGEIGVYQTKTRQLTMLREKPRGYEMGQQRVFGIFSPSGSDGIAIGKTAPAFYAYSNKEGIDAAAPGVPRRPSMRPTPAPEMQAPFVFSPNGLLFAGCLAGCIRVCSADTWQLLREIKLSAKNIVTMRFSSDGSQLIAADSDQQIFICSVSRGVERTFTKKDFDIYSKPGCVMIDSDRKRAYVSSAYGVLFSISLVDGAHQKLGQVPLADQATVTEAFSPDGRWMVGVRGKAFYLYDLLKEEFVDLHDGHADQINGISSSPDGKRVALADADGVLRLWSTETGEREWMLEQILGENQRRESIFDVAYHPAGHELYGIQYWNKIRRWDLTSMLESPLTPSYYESITPNKQYPTTFALSTFTLGPDGDLAVISGPQSSADYSSENASYRVILYRLSEMKIVWVQSDNLSRFSTYSFSSDGSFVFQVIAAKEARTAIGGVDALERARPQDHAGLGRIFSVTDGTIVKTLRGPKGENLRAGRLLSGGRVLAAMTGGLALWELEKPKEALYFDALDGATRPIALSEDESLFAAADEKGGVGLWDVRSGKLIERIALERAKDRASCMTFCRGSHRFVIGTSKGVGLVFGSI